MKTGKEVTKGPWTLTPYKNEEDQRPFEAEVEVTIDWDKLDARVKNVIGRAMRSAMAGKPGRASWLGGAISAKVRSWRRIEP